MSGPETRLYKKIKKAIEAEYPGSLVLKIHGNRFQNIGISDLLCCIRVKGKWKDVGVFTSIEVKVPGKGKKSNPTPPQARMLVEVSVAGGIAGCAHSTDEALAILRKGLKELRSKK
jgi:hypothetical protein